MASSSEGRVAGGLFAVVVGATAVAFVVVRMFISHARYLAWARSVKVEPTGFYEGRFLVVTVALLVTPVLIVFFGTRLRDDSVARWTTASGALLGLGAGMGTWFLLLGLRAPTTFHFVAIGVFTVVAGVGAGLVGVRAAARARRGRVDLAGSADLMKRRRLLKAGAAMGLIGSIGMGVSAVLIGSSSGLVGPRNAFLTVAAQLAPAVVVAAFAASLKLGLENRWEVAAGAWFGIGLSVGIAYLCVGVVYLFHPFSLAMALSGFAVAVGGDIAKEAAETIRRIEQAAYEQATAPDPQSHVHQGPVSGDLGLHLRNVHGRADLPSPARDKEALHDDLHDESPTKVST